MNRIALTLTAVLVLTFPAGASDLDEVGCGELLVRSGDRLQSLPVVDLAFEVDVTGVMARGRVTQRFRNVAAEVVDATYAFPLPDRAALSRMEIRIGERRIVSEIREREEARRTYAEARATGRKAALVEQRRADLFTTAVANINPGEEVAVELEYVEELRYADGSYELRVPLTFVPRYAPPGSRDEAEQAARSSPVPTARLEVRLDTGFPLARVTSDSHAIERSDEAGRATIRVRGGSLPADRDFVLRLEPALGRRPTGHLLIEERDGERYALFVFLPPDLRADSALGLPTETLFVVDVSGSMAGPSIAQAREALSAAVSRLRPDDRFNLMSFSDSTRLFRDDFEQAEGEPLDAARAWIASLSAGGGTRIEPALRRGLAILRESEGRLLQRIVFLTDGAVANEAELLRAMHEELGEVRLHTIGIGAAPNVRLMRKMAERGRGLCAFIASISGTENRIARFLERIDQPVLAGLRLEPDRAALVDPVPTIAPDLHAGEPIVLSARLAPGVDPTRLRLGGYSRDGWLELSVEEDGRPREGSGVALRWARARVEALLDDLLEGADPAAVRREVIDLALEHGLVTPYTSRVAVEDFPTALASEGGLLAAGLPTGGTDRPLRRTIGLLALLVGLAALWLAGTGRPS